jgi:hypothetical protein
MLKIHIIPINTAYGNQLAATKRSGLFYEEVPIENWDIILLFWLLLLPFIPDSDLSG